MRLLAVPVLAGALLAAPQARGDAELTLFDLLMAWESVSICGFPMPDEAAERVYDTIAAYEAELGKPASEMADLREQAAWQILRQKRDMCAADGSWRARYDELLTGLADG